MERKKTITRKKIINQETTGDKNMISSSRELPTEKNSSFSKSTLFLIIIALLAAGLYFYKFQTKKTLDDFQNKIIPETIKKVVNNPAVTIKDIKNLKEVSGLYSFDFTYESNGTPRVFSSYITKDGTILFQSGIEIAKLNQPSTAGVSAAPKKTTCNDIKKTDKPELTAFVVADCPFGLQMQRVYKKALSEQPLLKDNLNIKYLGSIQDGKITSMHGDKEAQENLRQICIREEQKDKYWDYLSCYMKEGKSSDCLTSTNVNTTILNACTTDSNRGLKFAQVDFAAANKLGIGGSPTLILNGTDKVSEFDFGGRTADAIQQIVCCAFNNKPDFCQKALSKESLAASYSVNDVASGTSGSAANCGN